MCIAYDSAKVELFVPNHSSVHVSVISDATNAVTATISSSGYHAGVGYDPAKGEILVTERASDAVSVINDTTNAETGTAYVGYNPFYVEYDPGKGEMFVPNLGSNTVSVISDSIDTASGVFTVGPLSLPEFPAGGHALHLVESAAAYAAMRYGTVRTSKHVPNH